MIYLDNAATTKPSQKAIISATDAMQYEWFNPSSLYNDAGKTAQKIKQARQTIAELVGFKANQITFTSGSTEANNTVLLQDWDWIITTKIEHDSVWNTVSDYSTLHVPVDNRGYVELEALRNIVDSTPGKKLVSIIAVNNEIGTIQNIGYIADIVHNTPNCYLHLDATQCMGKLELPYNLADYVTASAHKFHGIKGVGFITHKYEINPYLKGGHQESGLRAGTENTPGILSMAVALKECYDDISDNFNKVKSLRDTMCKKILTNIAYVRANSDINNPYILNVSFKDVNAESLLLMLSLKGIYVSSGSACNSKSQKVSRILKEINVPDDYIYGTIRISFSPDNTSDEIETAYEAIKSCVESIRHSRGAAKLG